MHARGLLLPALAAVLAGSLARSDTAPSRPAAKPAPEPVLEGLVRGPGKKPLAKALVVARASRPEPGDTPLATHTDAYGRFRIAAKRRVPYHVRAETAGLAGRTLKDVAPGTLLTIDLETGGAIEGVVRDAETGAASAGVAVETWDRDAIGLAADPGVGRIQATTDAEGRFRLTGLGPGRHHLTARARGRGQATRKAVPHGTRVELLLRPAATIFGVLTGPDRHPLAGATVTVIGFRSPEGPRSERSDARGRYEVSGLTGGVYDVAVRAPGLAPGVVADVVLEPRGETQADVALHPGARVMGRLVDANDQPLAGRVAVGEIGGRAAPYVLADLLSAEAGADGRFVIAAVPPGDHALGAESPRQAPRRVELVVAGTQRQVDVGDVRMEAGLTIRGLVRARSGEAVAGATVRASGALGAPARMPPDARTDADGTFVLAGLDPAPYQLAASAPGYGRSDRTVEPGTDPIEFVLEPAGSIVGKVVDDRGNTLDAFRVIARPSSGGRPWAFREFEDAGGRFVLEDVAAGAYAVSVDAPERASVGLSAKVDPSGRTDIGTVRLGAGSTVRGTVVDAEGAFVAGARVMVEQQRGGITFGSPHEVLTDQAGAFEARGLEAGAIEIAASHPSYAPSTPVSVAVDPPTPTQDVRLVLGQGGRVEGSVRRRDGAPLAGVLVSATPGQQGWTSRAPLTPTKEDGTFVIDHVPAGRVRLSALTATGPGRYRSTQVREVEVRDGETTRVDIVDREILLSGRVTRSGTPASGLRLRASQGHEMTLGGHGTGVPSEVRVPERMAAVTREDGGFEMIVNEPGRLHVTVSSADGRTRLAMRTLDVPDAESFAVDIVLAGVPVTGTVVDEDGEPIPWANVSASSRGAATSLGGTGTAGPDGRFLLELEPADYLLGAVARESDFGYAHVNVTVGVDGLADARVTLPRARRISGWAVDPGGRAVSGMEVRAFTSPPATSDGDQTAADGSFEIRGLRAGVYHLVARTETGLFAVLPNVSAGTRNVQVRMRRGGRIVVQAATRDGQPVAGAWVGVITVDGMPLHGLLPPGTDTNAQGMTALPAPAGRLLLGVEKGSTYGQVTVDLAADETQQVRVTLEEHP